MDRQSTFLVWSSIWKPKGRLRSPFWWAVRGPFFDRPGWTRMASCFEATSEGQMVKAMVWPSAVLMAIGALARWARGLLGSCFSRGPSGSNLLLGLLFLGPFGFPAGAFRFLGPAKMVVRLSCFRLGWFL